MPRLKMLRGPEPNQEYRLTGESVTIGRGRKNDIIVEDNEVSRVHCRFIRVLDDYELHDVGSTNGTFVDGKKVDENGWLLDEECLVELGDSITFQYMPDDTITGTSPAVNTDIQQRIVKVPHYLVITQQSVAHPDIYLIDRPSITMGRDPDTDIVLQEPEVSRHHMRIVILPDGYSIEDLNTMNGTYLNDKRLEEPQQLKPGDMIRIGTRTTMWFTDNPDELIHSLRQGKNVRQIFDDKTHQTRARSQKATDEVPATAKMEAGALEGHVWIVYAREEWRTTTQGLYAYLREQNVPVWVDQSISPDSEQWRSAIDQALLECVALVAIVSERSLNSYAVNRAIRHFLTREKPVVLVRYGEISQMPINIESLPAITYDIEQSGRTYRTILAEIQKLNLR